MTASQSSSHQTIDLGQQHLSPRFVPGWNPTENGGSHILSLLSMVRAEELKNARPKKLARTKVSLQRLSYWMNRSFPSIAIGCPTLLSKRRMESRGVFVVERVFGNEATSFPLGKCFAMRGEPTAAG